MGPPELIENRIRALVPEVEQEFGGDLRKLLLRLHDNDASAVIQALSGLSLKLLERIFAGANRLGDYNSGSLQSCIIRASGGKEEGSSTKGSKPAAGDAGRLIPLAVEKYFDVLRVLSNKVSHHDNAMRIGLADARVALDIFLRALAWFFREYVHGPRLPVESIFGKLPTDRDERLRRMDDSRPHGLPAGLREGLRIDRKNVIHDPDISRRIVEGPLPPLADCVKTSRTTLIPVTAKNRPEVDGLAYNHFFGVGAVLTLSLPGIEKPIPLIASRGSGDPDEPGFKLKSGGVTLLWHASYWYQVTDILGQTPMDQWMTLAENAGPEEAERKLLDGSEGLLQEILKYKIDLGGLPKAIRPLGAVTNDLRNADLLGRVYSQYVFHIALSPDVPQASTDVTQILKSVPTQEGVQLRRMSRELKEEDFVDSSGRKNLMDLLIWRALQTPSEMMKAETATFFPAFSLTGDKPS